MPTARLRRGGCCFPASCTRYWGVPFCLTGKAITYSRSDQRVAHFWRAEVAQFWRAAKGHWSWSRSGLGRFLPRAAALLHGRTSAGCRGLAESRPSRLDGGRLLAGVTALRRTRNAALRCAIFSLNLISVGLPAFGEALPKSRVVHVSRQPSMFRPFAQQSPDGFTLLTVGSEAQESAWWSASKTT